jgi:hypothetical protein
MYFIIQIDFSLFNQIKQKSKGEFQYGFQNCQLFIFYLSFTADFALHLSETHINCWMR